MGKTAIEAAIDIGSNSVLLLIARKAGNRLIPLLQDAHITRISEGLFSSGTIQEEAFRRTMTVLQKYMERIREFGCDKIAVFGTAPFRIASNAIEIAAKIEALIGVPLRIISQQEEARFGYLGVKSGSYLVSKDDSMLVIELGGASTQITYLMPNGQLNTLLIDGGVVKWTEQYNLNDMGASHPEPVYRDFKKDMESHLAPLFRNRFSALVFLGGSATTIAAMAQEMEKYDFEKIDGYTLRKSGMEHILHQVTGKSLHEIREMKGMESGREDVIRAGLFFIKAVAELFNKETVLVSARGPRFGILLDELEYI